MIVICFGFVVVLQFDNQVNESESELLVESVTYNNWRFFPGLDCIVKGKLKLKDF